MSCWHRWCPQWDSCFVQCFTHYLNTLISNEFLCHRCSCQHWAQHRFYPLQMIGSKLANLISKTTLRQSLFTKIVNHFTHINLHWARSATQSIACTSFITCILELFFKTLQTSIILTGYTQTRQLSLNHNTLT